MVDLLYSLVVVWILRVVYYVTKNCRKGRKQAEAASKQPAWTRPRPKTVHLPPLPPPSPRRPRRDTGYGIYITSAAPSIPARPPPQPIHPSPQEGPPTGCVGRNLLDLPRKIPADRPRFPAKGIRRLSEAAAAAAAAVGVPLKNK